MKSAIGRFLKLWPVGAQYAVFALPIGLAMWIIGTVSDFSEETALAWRLFVALIIVSGLITAGLAVSDMGGDEEKRALSGRSFAMSRTTWLLRPLRISGFRLTGGTPSFQAITAVQLIVYFALLPLIAVCRAVRLVIVRPPQSGDVVSFRAPGEEGGFRICAVERLTESQVEVLVLAAPTSRPRGFRLRDLAPRTERSVLARADFDEARSKFMWRGPMYFWNPAPASLGGRSGDWSAIEAASRRVEELERLDEI